jgi:type II secretory pathway component GspD/PulD (secretin)
MFDATKKDSLKSRLPSLEDQGNAQLRKKYSLLIDATRNTAPPVSGFKNSTAVNSGSKKNFISQEFTSTQLVVILKFLADRLGLNLITSPHMDESKSVVLSEMTAEEAIPLVLKGTDYCYRISGNLLLVGPSDIIETLSPDITADLSAEEIVRIFVLRKVRVEKIRAELEDTFPKAKVEARKGLNAFIITAEKSTMDKIEQFLKKKDR